MKEIRDIIFYRLHVKINSPQYLDKIYFFGYNQLGMFLRYSSNTTKRDKRLPKVAKVYTRRDIKIDCSSIDSDAIAIISRLKQRGFDAFFVGVESFKSSELKELSKLFIIKFAEPVFACIFGAILLGENIFRVQYVLAFLLIATGIYISNK